MKKFLKEYLGLLAAVGLAGGSLFAFTISTSIDNALQVIKTIWVTSDGTTNNPPFMTMDGSGKYVSIGTIASGETLNVSGSVFAQDSDVSMFLLSDATNLFGGPLGGVGMQIDGSASDALATRFVLYDLRGVGKQEMGLNVSTNSKIGSPQGAWEAMINSKNGENIDLDVKSDLITFIDPLTNQPTGATASNTSQISMDNDFIKIAVDSGIVYNSDGSGGYNTNSDIFATIDISPNTIRMYGTGGSGFLLFDSMLGRFGFSTWTPGNIIHIANSVNNSLGLRLTAMSGYSGYVLGLNADQDVIPIAPLNSLQGGGGGSSGPWEYGAGSPQSAQIKSAGNTSNGSRSVVGGLNNIGDGYASFVGGGLYNEATSSGNVAVGGAYNKSYGLLLSSIVGGTNNTINSAGNVSFIGGGSDNIINERNSAIVVGSNNLIDAVSSAIVGGEYNAIHSSATQAFIGGGSGNATSGSLSFIGGGSDNMLAGLYATLVGGLTNILNGNYGFIGGGASNVLSVGALYSLIGGGENNSITDRYSSIVGGLNNVNQAEKSFIGGGEGNNIALNSLGAVIVGGYYNANSSAGGFIGAGAGNFATGGDAQFIGAGGNNIINEGNQSVIVGGRNNTLSGARSFIGGGEGHIIDSAQFAAILGGNMNTVLDDNGIVVGGESNQSRGYGDVIVGGIMNTINGARSAILGGNSNILSGAGESILVGGSENTLTNGNFSFLGAGRQNVIHTLPGDGYNTLIGGQANVISGGAYNSIVGGYDNTMWDGAYSFIGGGFGNTANVFYGTVAGGLNNIVAGFGGTIAGGLNNSSAGPASFIGGGSGNIAYSSYAATIGGNNIYANGIGAAIAGGHTNYANGANSFIAGSNNNTSGDNTVALGSYAEALHANTFVRSDGVPTFASLAPNTFLIKATNGVAINTNDTNNKALRVNGSVQANNYYSANDNAGHTQTIVNIAGGGCTMYFENGLLVATSGC